jgi:hypothetical protein
LPFLRFARDKRGYEITALVHAFRGRHGRTRQKLLYWFRTPPSVKVGRPALDEEAIRWIEEHNPDIDFDWPKILESTPPAAPPAEDGKARRGRREKTEGRARGGQRPAQRPTQPPTSAARPEMSVAAQAIDDLNLPEPPDQETAEGEETAAEGEETAPEVEETAPEVEALEQLTHPDAEELSAGARAPVETMVAREQLVRLRARYAELQARITELGGEAARIEELRAQAEPLNPDSWVTSDEAKKGLEEFEARIRDLRAALGLRRHRRSRRGGRRRRGRPTEHASQAAAKDSPSNTPDEPSKSNEPG